MANIAAANTDDTDPDISITVMGIRKIQIPFRPVGRIRKYKSEENEAGRDKSIKNHEQVKVFNMAHKYNESYSLPSDDIAPVILPFAVTEEFFIEPLPPMKRRRRYDFLKRLADILLALLGIILAAIPMLVIAVMIKVKMGGTVFYCQIRLGLNGKAFKIIKFRTMHVDAEAAGAKWSDGDQDPRITKFGTFLRQYRLDELPQFFNVLAGSMSLVGPRPERPCFYNAFETYIHGFSQRLAVKPGITGLAQVRGGYNIRPEEKIVYDIEYIKKRSLWLDFLILLKTFQTVLCSSNVRH